MKNPFVTWALGVLVPATLLLGGCGTPVATSDTNELPFEQAAALATDNLAKAGQSFDTSTGLPGAGRGGSTPAQRSLLAMFDASPGYKTAKRALRDAARKHDIDYELLQALVATESGFDPQAISP